MDLKALGAACREFRNTLGYTQLKVSEDTGISREVISDFENGRSKNVVILDWYLKKGFEYGKY